MREVYKKLGVFEPEDQTEFANYLINNKDYKIDKDNVAIWGWVNIWILFVWALNNLNIYSKLKNCFYGYKLFLYFKVYNGTIHLPKLLNV